jgi:uncharacterized protein
MNRLLPNQLLTLIFFLGCALSAQAQKEIPELWGQHVHDEAKVLSQQSVDNLERRLKIFEDSTTNQIAILIVPSLDGEIVEQYALRVAEKWKLGQKDKDNGVVLLVAINDRKMRIEVGQGLEGPLPDAICNRIIRNEMAPNFRRGDYDAGVNAAIDGIMLAIKGEYKADQAPASGKPGGRFPVFLIAFILFILFRFLSRRGGRTSGWSSGAGWFIGGGGGGGGGGFSGGGGSFGGGGSSGSW